MSICSLIMIMVEYPKNYLLRKSKRSGETTVEHFLTLRYTLGNSRFQKKRYFSADNLLFEGHLESQEHIWSIS